MRYLFVLLFFLPFCSFGYSVIHYNHYTLKNTKNETELVALTFNEKEKLLVMSSITTEFLYEVNTFEQPHNIYLLDNPDFIIKRTLVWGKKNAEHKLFLYYRGMLTDSLSTIEPFEEIFNDNSNRDLYYSDSLGSMQLKWIGNYYTVNPETGHFDKTAAQKGSYRNINGLNEISPYVNGENELMADGKLFEKWVMENCRFENGTELRITVAVIDGETHCRVDMFGHDNKTYNAQLKQLENLIEKAKLTDSFYLDRIKSWYFQKTVIINHQKE